MPNTPDADDSFPIPLISRPDESRLLEPESTGPVDDSGSLPPFVSVRPNPLEDPPSSGPVDDSLYGTADRDVFFFHDYDGPFGNDTIFDFNVGEDLIDLRAFDRISSFEQIPIDQSGNDTIIDLTEFGGGVIRLSDVEPSDFDASSFVLTVLGTEQDDEIVGSAASESIFAVDGDDVIVADAGDDIVFAGNGDDVIVGGEGDDELLGHGGADSFVYGIGDGHDVVYDFTNGVDRIDLTRISGLAGFEELNLLVGDEATVIDFERFGGGSITLDHVAIADLDASDFVFADPDGSDFVFADLAHPVEISDAM